MYVPKQFQNDNSQEVKDFIDHNGFGILINQTNGKLWGTHLPLQLSEDGSKLYGHLSKANPQWRNFESGQEVMAIFTGPHAYISSSWYNHENVPTWNYVAAHVYGDIKIIEGEVLLQSLKRLVDKYEKASAKPVSVERMTPEYLKREMQGITGFEITIREIKAAYKLSQNRDKINHGRVVEELEKRADHDSLRVAELMKKKWPNII